MLSVNTDTRFPFALHHVVQLCMLNININIIWIHVKMKYVKENSP